MSLDKQPLELNAGFKYVLDVLEKTEQSLFITGRAGTGKSTLLQLFRSTTKKKTVVVAPTGIAALNVKGQTIHSLFGFPPRLIMAKDIKKGRNKKWFKKIQVLIIDEISMVRADVLDAIDRSLRLNRENPLPFGGVQLAVFGDLFQLPPIVSTEEEKRLFEVVFETPYFFSAHVLQEMNLEMLELRKVYRQENRLFLRLLDAVRLNQVDWDDLEDLNGRYQPSFEATKSYITLSPRNAVVDRINQREMANLSTDEHLYTATIKGSFDPRLYPTEPVMHLKVGAQVMFIKNDPEGEFVNGTIGHITELHADSVKVFTDEESKPREITVTPMEWEILKYKESITDPNDFETEVLGTFKQYPLKLAWAVTIHKSQGKTFDKVVIDMGSGAFEFGQTYVALSRCRTLEGIVLKQKLRHKDIMVDERIVDYYEQNFRS
ncbi:MAG: AAA family ATPase [Saprospiraceae bacterium]|nr:MAG: AAA family ATPase [Saprospiraceae bacterium]